jgi:uncharacterized membrane protein YfcA
VSAWWLVPLSCLTSALAGAVGLGGGVLLLTLMPGLVPTGAILPLHAITQLASNVSRAAFGWREICWRLLPALIVGGLLGVWAGGALYASVDLRWLPVLVGSLILLITWMPLPVPRGSGGLALALVGCYQTGLGMLAGATGPLGSAVLARYGSQRDGLVVNTAVYQSLGHGLRALAYLALGFSIAPWWPLVGAMVLASIAGSWLGTRLRQHLPQANFLRWFRVLVSVLALRMILLAG